LSIVKIFHETLDKYHYLTYNISMPTKYPCPKCSSPNYQIKDGGIFDDNYYYFNVECRSCHHLSEFKKPLVLPEDGLYTYQWFNNKIYALHRLVWEWVHKEAPRGIIHHLNGHRRDNRPSNLYNMNTGHSPYLNSNNSTIIIQKLKARVRQLENTISQIKGRFL